MCLGAGGRYLFIGGTADTPVVTTIDVMTTRGYDIPALAKTIRGAAVVMDVSQDGQRLASLNPGKPSVVTVTNVATGEALREIKTGLQGLRSISVSAPTSICMMHGFDGNLHSRMPLEWFHDCSLEALACG
jgi:hypothetical protein